MKKDIYSNITEFDPEVKEVNNPQEVVVKVEYPEGYNPQDHQEEIAKVEQTIKDLNIQLEEEKKKAALPPTIVKVEFPKEFDARIINLPEPIKPVPVNMSKVEKLLESILNFKNKEQKVQKVEITNPVPQLDLPTGTGDIPGKADPSKYVNVRLTNGKRFYNALEDAFVSAAKAVFPFVNLNGAPTPAKLDSTNTLYTNPGALSSVNDSVSVIQSTPGVIGSPWFMKLTDGVSSNQFDPAQNLRVSTEGQMGTYTTTVSGLVTASSATDIFTIAGAANKVIRIDKISISATATSAAVADLLLIRRSAVDTSGTSSVPVAVQHDTNDSVASAVIAAYTANPTLGTLVGILLAEKLFISTATTQPQRLELTFGTRNSKAIYLRGAAQQLAINLAGVTYAGSSFDIAVEWTEATT